MVGAHVSSRSCRRRGAAAGMRGIDGPYVHERPVRHDVQRAVVSRLVLETGFVARVRVSPAFLAASAAAAKRAPLGLEGAGAHVCPAEFVIDLSRRTFRPGPSRTAASTLCGGSAGR